MSHYYNDAIFWVEVDKIKPNPYQPRKEFNDSGLQGLADSIRQYGVLQALVVTRREIPKEDGGLATEYELISGERRLRASKLAGVREVPVLIRTDEDSDLMKLELAIIENVQREDLNPIDRAKAFQQLAEKFRLTHRQIAQKIGKSREYVTNSVRLLSMTPEMLEALGRGQIYEGHSRPLLMLSDRPEEQTTLFKEIVNRKLTVREAETIAKRIAHDRVRKKSIIDPEIAELEERFQESLGTKVSIEKRENGGKLSIDFFSNDDLRAILDLLGPQKAQKIKETLENPASSEEHISQVSSEEGLGSKNLQEGVGSEPSKEEPNSEIAKEEEEEDEEDLYSIKNFSV